MMPSRQETEVLLPIPAMMAMASSESIVALSLSVSDLDDVCQSPKPAKPSTWKESSVWALLMLVKSKRASAPISKESKW